MLVATVTSESRAIESEGMKKDRLILSRNQRSPNFNQLYFQLFLHSLLPTTFAYHLCLLFFHFTFAYFLLYFNFSLTFTFSYLFCLLFVTSLTFSFSYFSYTFTSTSTYTIYTNCLREPLKKNCTIVICKPAIATIKNTSKILKKKILSSVDLTVSWFLLFLVL